jgi:plastocyanin
MSIVSSSADTNQKNTSEIIISTISSGASNSTNAIYHFTPAVILIPQGQTVQWVNKDQVNHSITSTNFKSDTLYPERNKKYASTFTYTFPRAGIYVYFDGLHPNVGGVVYVNSSETQRELIPTSSDTNPILHVEMPENSAYQNKLGAYFIPSYLNMSEGSKVMWTNKDYIPHTATAADGSFDTKPIMTGKSVSEVMNSAGLITYYCKIHPWMIGIMQVTKSE